MIINILNRTPITFPQRVIFKFQIRFFWNKKWNNSGTTFFLFNFCSAFLEQFFFVPFLFRFLFHFLFSPKSPLYAPQPQKYTHTNITGTTGTRDVDTSENIYIYSENVPYYIKIGVIIEVFKIVVPLVPPFRFYILIGKI